MLGIHLSTLASTAMPESMTMPHSWFDFEVTEFFFSCFLPGIGKKEKMRKGTTHSSAKAKSTPIMSTKIFSDTFGVQNITKQS